MKTFNLHLFTAVGLAAGISAVASAGPVQGQHIYLEYKTSSPSLPVHINYVFNEAADSATRSGGTFGYAGFVNWKSGVRSFCAQVKEDIPAGTTIEYTFEYLADIPDSDPSGMGQMRATMIQDLYSRWWPAVNAVGMYDTSGRDLCAAFQAMIWEISHETLSDTGGDPGEMQVDALNLTEGAMQLGMMTTGATHYFSQMKADLGGSRHDDWLNSLGSSLWGLSNPDYQDQIIVVPGAAAGFIGLGIFGARRRRRR